MSKKIINFSKTLRTYGQKFDYKDVVLEEFQGIKSSKLKVIQNLSVTLYVISMMLFLMKMSGVFNKKGCERCKIEDNYKSIKRKEDLQVFLGGNTMKY